MSSSKVTLVVIWVGVLIASATAATCVREDCSGNQKDEDWDYLLFVVQWPQSFCLYYNASHSNGDQKCIVPNGINNWTVHGTWPTKIGTEGPVNCNNTWTFNFSKVKDLVTELNQMWPDLLSGSSYDSLWAHEWDKHGTCASTLPALYGEHNYFATTIKLWHHFNIDNFLRVSGIIPSKTANYSHDAILKAIKAGTGCTPDLTCYQKNNHDGTGFEQYLAEVRLCIDKTFKPMECPKSLTKPLTRTAYYDPCSAKTFIMLPPITP